MSAPKHLSASLFKVWFLLSVGKRVRHSCRRTLPRVPAQQCELQVAASVAMGALRAMAFNLLRATSAFRLREVSADLIGLTGTGRLQPHSTARHEKRFEERCRYRDAQFSNGSAGVSILLNNKTWQSTLVRRVFDTPRSRQGRVGAARLRRGQDHVTATVM